MSIGGLSIINRWFDGGFGRFPTARPKRTMSWKEVEEDPTKVWPFGMVVDGLFPPAKAMLF